VIDINQCTLCGECLKICPVNAMTLVGLDSRDQNQERAGTDGKYQT
jgi:ferredoxin